MIKRIIILALIVIAFFVGLQLGSAQLNNATSYWTFDTVGFPTVEFDTKFVLNLTLNNTLLRIQKGKLANAIRLNNSNLNVAINQTRVPNTLIFDQNPFTIAFWINASNGDGGTSFTVLGRAGSSATKWTINTNSGNNNLTFVVNSAGVLSSPNMTLNGSYNRVVFVREGTGAGQFRVYMNNINYVNATLSNNLSDQTESLVISSANGGSTGFNLDDVRLYNNYAWNLSDVSTDWNNGQGQTFGTNLILNSPTEGQVITTNSFLFNTTSLPTTQLLALLNTTVYIYFANGTLFTKQTNVTVSTQRNNSLFNISNFQIGNYFWDAYACGINPQFNDICFNSNNGNTTFSWGFQFTDWFSNPVVEGSLQTVYLNVTLGSAQTISSANLIYNGTVLAGSIAQINSTFYQVTRTLTTPSVTTDTSVLLNWNVTLSNGFNHATPVRNQSILALNIGNCASFPDLILNYSVFDEDTRIRLTGQADNVTIQAYVELIPIGATMPASTYNRTYNVVNDTNTASVCASAGVLGNGTYSMNVLTNYVSYLHEPESYVYQNYTLSSTSGFLGIDLYNLITTNAQQFKIRYLDRAFIPVNGVVIEINRFYTGLGTNLIVEAPVTGTDGSTVASLVLNDEVYTFVVKKNNQILSTFSNLRVFCNSAIASCTLDLPARTSSGNLGSQTCSAGVCIISSRYNETSRVYSATFNVIDSSTKTINLNITRGGINSSQICFNSLSASSGTVTCTIGVQDLEIMAYARMYVNNTLIATDSFFTGSFDSSTSGLRMILSIMLIVSLAGIFSSNRALLSFSLVIGVLIASWLHLLNIGGRGSSTGIIIWLILVVLILIIRIKNSTKEWGNAP